jgi:hypothetical protein
MLDGTEYVAAWIAYLLAALGLMAVWWRITRILPWQPLKQLLRIVVAAPLLIPAPVSSGSLEWAPAVFVLLFDMTLLEEGDPLRALDYVLYALLLALLVLVADGVFRHWRTRNRNNSPPAEANS